MVEFLGDPTWLVWHADDALRLDVSARNAVFGLYHGWYKGDGFKRFRRSGLLGLKDISFEDDRHWYWARDVLIARLTHADRVAEHGRAVFKLLHFIPRAEFEAKFGPKPAPPVTPVPPVAQPPVPPVPTPPPVVVIPTNPVPAPAPAQPPGAVDLPMAEIKRAIESLRQKVASISTGVSEIDRDLGGLHGKVSQAAESQAAARAPPVSVLTGTASKSGSPEPEPEAVAASDDAGDPGDAPEYAISPVAPGATSQPFDTGPEGTIGATPMMPEAGAGAGKHDAATDEPRVSGDVFRGLIEKPLDPSDVVAPLPPGRLTVSGVRPR